MDPEPVNPGGRMTHGTPDLTTRLLAALDAEQQIAEAATPGEWHGTTIDSIAGGTIYDATVAIANVEWDNLPWTSGVRRFRSEEEADGNSAHIAYQHPQRTLRRVAALRRIVERHGYVWDCCPDEPFPDHALCAESHHADWPCPDLLDIATALGVEP